MRSTVKINVFNLANLITTTRIVIVAVFALIISANPQIFGFWFGALIIILIFTSDSLDGYIARKFGFDSEHGAFYDITGDRITEIVLLLPFLYLQIIDPLLPVYFVAKGFLIDYRRMKGYLQKNTVPFKQVEGRIRKLLVASRQMRAVYGFLKMLLVLLLYLTIFDKSENVQQLVNLTAFVTLLVSLSRTVPNFI